jgi:hypothetical protein
MTPEAAFGYGCVGGFLLSLVRLIELANMPKIQRPSTFSDWIWVVQFVGVPIIGGILAYVYAADEAIKLNRILAVNIGISGQIIVKAMAAVAPKQIGRTD